MLRLIKKYQKNKELEKEFISKFNIYVFRVSNNSKVSKDLYLSFARLELIYFMRLYKQPMGDREEYLTDDIKPTTELVEYCIDIKNKGLENLYRKAYREYKTC